jgi:N-carbamoylputrescine amidase
LRVALAQIDCVLGDTEENLRKAKEVLAEPKDSGDLTVFPDLSLSGHVLGDLREEVTFLPLCR